MADYPVQRRFAYQGTQWNARRQPGVWAGTARRGILIPFPPPPGIRFVSAAGESRFVRVDYPELPREEDFEALPESRLIELLNRSAPEIPGANEQT